MKNTIYIIFILALSLLTGCEDFLEEESKANVTAEEFYITETGFESLVNANYSAYREIYGQDPWLFMCGTDLYSEGRDQEPVGLSRYTELTPAAVGVDFLYTNCYTSIQRANTAIYYSELTEQVPHINQRVGEIKFLRANSYFLLVQTYGSVSLITEFLDEAITSFERNSEEEVYSFIISELEEALTLVNDDAYSGRVNKRAVRHLLAKVHLTRAYEIYAANDDFSKAASYADAAINNQTLDIPFEDLWLPSNDMNAEVIFSVQFSATSIATAPTRLGSQQQNFFGSYLGGNEVAGDAPFKTYNLCPTRFALDLFTEGDARWEATFMTEIYERYYDYYDVSDKSNLTAVHFYEPQWFTDADSVAYVAENPNVIYHKYGTHDPDGGDVSNNFSTIVVKKFDDPTSLFAPEDDERRVSTRDFIMARLGETYLIAAEAYLGAGDPTTGLNRLNEVRRRAGVADAAAGDFNIDFILDERGRELLGEYHRWFDLKRTGKLIERASAHHRLVDESNFVGNNGELKILRPIPQAALDLNQNTNFKQNPAYN